MREYGQIQCAFWQSDDATHATDAGKLLAAYLMTGPHSNGLGCYRCPDGYVMEDLGWSSERVSQGFAELSRNGFAYRFDGVVFMPAFLRWNKIANGNVAMARMGEFLALPKGKAKGHTARAMLTFGKHFSDDDRDHLGTVAATVTETVCQTEPYQTQPEQDPLLPSATPNGDHAGTVNLASHKAERLMTVAAEAVAAYNAALGKPKGLLSAVHLVNDVRRDQVKRVIPTARLICEQQSGSTAITKEFWETYFAECASDPWKRGEGPYTGSHSNWRPDFEYLTRKDVMTAVFDKAMSRDDEEAA